MNNIEYISFLVLELGFLCIYIRYVHTDNSGLLTRLY
jgi:hypothetical protein